MFKKILPITLSLALLVAGCASPAASSQTEPSAATDAAGTTAGEPFVPLAVAASLSYPIVDTGQGKCYDNNAEIPCPAAGEAFYGQDAQYSGFQSGYVDNGDGTVSDLVTGLTWMQSPDLNGDGNITAADKLAFSAAGPYCEGLSLAGADDWRLPDIKTLYSLIDFGGTDPSSVSGTASLIPFIDNNYFAFAYGDVSAGERTIDSQYASSTLYVNTNTNDGGKDFGVNFADGRIKGYGLDNRGAEKTFLVLCVRGNPDYGVNDFVDNGDGTIADLATGLVWQQADSASALNWQEALSYCEDLSLAGSDDWRLPDAKSLQSIVDYTRSPATTNSAAIDPLFRATQITDEAGLADYPFYWTSTTHAGSDGGGTTADYVAFGEALGYMNDTWVDVHGAGAQRSDPKSGDPAQFPTGRGPQGDAIRIYNYVRCVRAGEVASTPAGDPTHIRPAMTVESTGVQEGSGAGNGGQAAGQGQTPPQEAIAACTASTVGAACQFSSPNGIIMGTCQSIQQQLACAPASAPSRP